MSLASELILYYMWPAGCGMFGSGPWQPRATEPLDARGVEH